MQIVAGGVFAEFLHVGLAVEAAPRRSKWPGGPQGVSALGSLTGTYVFDAGSEKDMRLREGVLCAGLLLVGRYVFACEQQPVHFQAIAMSHRIVQRTPMVLQGHAMRIKGTIELLVVVGDDGKPFCISVIRGHPILTSTAIANVKQWRFRPYHKNRKLVRYSGTLVVST